ncbi:MAG: ribonuclease III [Armatimonadia bacterium]|nr:ribonuclease III [Armatimonadia bacterium]
MNDFQERIGYRFRDGSLLRRARIHSSYASDEGLSPTESNQRLEFLGDAVIDLVVSRVLYDAHPDWPEGRLTQARASFVSTQALAEAAAALDLGAVLLMARGEELTGGRQRRSCLADAMEALVGAIYLDGGLEPAEAFVRAHLLGGRERSEHIAATDPKTALQEQAQAAGGPTPRYELLESYGPSHDPTFVVAVRLGSRVLAAGEGTSKKAAERAAAAAALSRAGQSLPAGTEGAAE